MNIWDLVAAPILKIIDKVIPDNAARDAAKLELMKMQLNKEFQSLDQEFQITLAQIAVNKEEAASPDNFRAGWRPACGWVCVFGFGYMAILRPILPWLLTSVGLAVPELPAIQTDMLYVLLTGMLGLGGLRSFDKTKGTA